MRSLIATATRHGIPIEALIDRVAIEQGLLNSNSARVDLQVFSRLYSNLVAKLGDEVLGFYERPTRIGSVETLCRVGVTTSSFADCIAAVTHGCNAVLGGHTATCSFEHGQGQIVFQPSSTVHGEPLIAHAVVLLTIYSVISWLFGQRLPLARADFPCATPRHLYELRTLLGSGLNFNQPQMLLRFTEQASALQVVRSAGEIPRFIRRTPRSLIEALLLRDSLVLDVRRAIQRSLPTLLSLREVASQLAMSPRTLHRKLESEGTSFQAVKDDLRRDIALRLLTRDTTPLKQIAEQLGYSDQPTFQRAFSAWMGLTPGEYRKRATRSATPEK